MKKTTIYEVIEAVVLALILFCLVALLNLEIGIGAGTSE